MVWRCAPPTTSTSPTTSTTGYWNHRRGKSHTRAWAPRQLMSRQGARGVGPTRRASGPRRCSIIQNRQPCAAGSYSPPTESRSKPSTSRFTTPPPTRSTAGQDSCRCPAPHSRCRCTDHQQITGRLSVTRRTTATAGPPTGPPVSSRSVTNRPAVPGSAPGSAAKD
jgi:hypothetical protein